MSAQRASAPVRFAGFVAAAVLVALAAIVAIRLAGRRDVPPPPAAAPPPEDRVVDLKERVRHEEYAAGRLVAEIRGDTFARGPDGRNHLAGSVEVASYGRDGAAVSRLTAGEIDYAPGTQRFTVRGNVRVEAGGIILEGDSFVYDKAEGLFETTGGGRFASETVRGQAPEISYKEGAEEVRLGGGFRVEIAEADGTGRAAVLSGDSFVFERRGRRGRVEGRAGLEGAGFRGSSAAAAFAASKDGSFLESAVFEGAAKVVLAGDGPEGQGPGEVGADRIAVAFAREPFAVLSVEAERNVVLSRRGPGGASAHVEAPAAALEFDRDGGLSGWSASGGVRAEIVDADGLGHTVDGEKASFDRAAGAVRAEGRPGRKAVADSAETRVEADSISIGPDDGDLQASGGVRCVFRSGEGRRAPGFFSPGKEVFVSCDALVFRSGTSSVSLTGNVLARQGSEFLDAGELEFSAEKGKTRGRGGVTAGLTEASAGAAVGRTILLSGETVDYLSDTRTLVFEGKALVRIDEARLEARMISVIVAPGGNLLESLSAKKDVAVSKGAYEGRSQAASYQPASGQLVLTGNPVLTDGKGGSARGAKLTFDLADDKILVENEGSGRSTTIVKS